jgi:DNA-binding CsgD family transcriptional regulator
VTDLQAFACPIHPASHGKCLQMTKEELEGYLAEGLSLEQIGKQVGRHPSTISYHLKKHGLKPLHQDKYAAKGGISRTTLEAMVMEQIPAKEMARRLDRSYSTVRHWLMKYGNWPLPATKRRAEAKRAREQGLKYVEMECSRHGRTKFILEGRGYHRCTRCRMERVSEWRRRAKRRLLETAGGACALCGYDTYPGALQFHHLNPADKSFSIGSEGVTRSFAQLKAEAGKCVLLCANCHAEVEGGFTALRN